MSVVLLLNSKKVPLDIQNRFGSVYPLDLPVASKTIKDFLLEAFSEEDKIVIVNECEEKTKSTTLIELVKDSIYELELLPSESDTLFQTIQSAITELIKNSQSDFSLIINYGDTIIQEQFPLNETDFIVVGEKGKDRTWDYVTRENGKLSFFYKEEMSIDSDINTAVAGQFRFSSTQSLARAFQEVAKKKEEVVDEKKSVDLFYEVLNEYDELFHPLSILLTESWLDFGHKEDYLTTQTIVQARYFNEITIDRDRGILTKRSTDVKKFIGEINWYLKIPKELQYLVPKVYDYSTDDRQPYIAMEYYPYETIHTSYIYGNLDPGIWYKMIDKIFFIQQELREKSQLGNLLSETDLTSIYLNKTIQRVKKLIEDPSFSHFKKQPPIINGVTYPCLANILRELPDVLKKFSITVEKEASIIHGDFCLSNILLDVESQLVKLIDPRGKFGEHDIYGDEYYDIAKILHSFEGGYDHIITDNFDFEEQSPLSFTYCIKKTDLQVEISDFVLRKIETYYDIEKIRLIEGLLFLSMIPLHKDTPKRQKIMYGQAMKLLAPYFGGTI